MAYQAHTLVTFGGTLAEKAADDEIWQCGFRGFAPGGGPVSASDLGALALLVLRGPTGSGGGLEGIFAASGSQIPTTAKLVWCKAVNIGPDGNYSSEPGMAQMTPKAGAVAAILPSFNCLALSWTTGKSLGRAVRGRCYPPNYGAQLSTGSIISTTTQTALKDWALTLLGAVDTSLQTPEFHPYVVSSMGVSNVITGARVGNVVDTQRRRKDKNAETYVSGSFTP